MAVRPKKALVTAPAFSEYERALGTVGAEVQYYRLKEEQDFRIQEDILEQITEDTDMIFCAIPIIRPDRQRKKNYADPCDEQV